jgi:hypothetical protein
MRPTSGRPPGRRRPARHKLVLLRVYVGRIVLSTPQAQKARAQALYYPRFTGVTADLGCRHPALHRSVGGAGCRLHSEARARNDPPPCALYFTHYTGPCDKGGANSVAFHASRRAWRFYSRYRLRTTWWAPEKSKDIIAARARSFRVRQSWRRIEAPTRSSAIGTEVSAERHKSACCSTAGEDQQGLRMYGWEGRRWLQ